MPGPSPITTPRSSSPANSRANPPTPHAPHDDDDAAPPRPDPPRRSSSIRFHAMPHPRSSGDADERTAFVSRENSTHGRTYATTASIVRDRGSTASNPSTTSEAGGSSRPSPEDGSSQPSVQEGDGPKERDGFVAWWTGLRDKYGSVELENKGSVARDHLALERTFLAWLRTSLAFASIGIAVTQLFRLNTSIATEGASASGTPSDAEVRLRHVGKPLGATFIAVAMVVLFTGYHRYFEGQFYIIRGRFPASRGSVILIALCAGALIVSSLVVILAFGRGQLET